MTTIRRNHSGISRTALTVALFCGVMGGAGQALAAPQDADTSTGTATSDDTTVVVVGSRKALKSAQDIKKNADTIVDSITATDIGSFPDKSVADALQRVPGVSVVRTVTSGGEDSMHYPAEPSGVLIRGLQQVKSEFNGRDIFSAGSASGLSWEDVSPELLAGVDTYKNATAAMIEGGIAGTVNLRTRLPFDQKGRLFSANFEGAYGDLTKKWTPSASLLYSDRFDTDLGKFGYLLDGAYSNVQTTSQAVTNQRYVPFAPNVVQPGQTSMVYIPAIEQYGQTVYDRTRKGLAFAGQWESNDSHFKATLQYTNSSYQSDWTENQIYGQIYYPPAFSDESYVEANAGGWGLPLPATSAAPTSANPNAIADGIPFTFASNGMFQTGVLGSGVGTWGRGGISDWSTSPPTYDPSSTDALGNYNMYGVNEPVYKPCLDSDADGNKLCSYGDRVDLESRYSTETRMVEDASFNLKWMPTDRLRFSFDVQHVKSNSKHYDVTHVMSTFANLGLDMTGDLPHLNFLTPSNMNVLGGSNFMADYRNYSNTSLMDHLENSRASMDAFQIDGAYMFDSPWLAEFDAGVRMSDRTQDNQLSAYDWQPISNWWETPDQRPSYHLDSPASSVFAGYPGTYWQTTTFGTQGLLGGLLGTNQFVTIQPSYLKDINLLEATFGKTAQSANGLTPISHWDPICMRAGNLPNSCFNAGEIVNIKLKQNSAYAMLKFGGSDAVIAGGITLSGNVGIRFVQTDLTSDGAVNYPQQVQTQPCLPLTPQEIAALPPGAYPISVACLVDNSTADLAFSNGGFSGDSVKTKHTYTLPSLNLRFALPDDYIVRFSVSRGMYMPDVGLLKNYTVIQGNIPSQSNVVTGNPSVVLNSAGQPSSLVFNYTGSTGNPRLKATTADQFDITIERYFAAVGSFSLDLFTKKFHDYVQSGTFSVPYTNQGVTRNVLITGPVNGQGATITGLEVAGQRYFTFLPSPFDGLGVEANYTHLHNSGVQNTSLSLVTGGNGYSGDANSLVTTSQQPGAINTGRLERLSDDAYNLILLYDKGPIGARLAYNWRSKYVSALNDCCLLFPVWTKAEGYLDASIRYAINSNMEFDIQGNNILGERPKIEEEVRGPSGANPTQTPLFLPGGQFNFDRRIQVSLRFKY